MFCPQCGTNNQDGAAFCANCGNPFPQQQQPAAPGGTPAGIGGQIQNGIDGVAGQVQNGVGGALAKAGGSNTKLIIMGVAALAVIVLLIMLIRGFACAPGALNLNDAVLKDPKDVASMIDKYEEVKIYGQKVIVSDKQFADDLKDSILEDATDDKEAAEKVKKSDGKWALYMSDKKGNYLTKDDIKDGDDPAAVSVMTIVIEGDMTCEKMDKILSKWVTYDDVIMARDKSYITGYFSNDGIVGYVNAARGDDEIKDAWSVTITVYDEDVNSGLADSMKYAKNNWDDKDYKEVYKKK